MDRPQRRCSELYMKRDTANAIRKGNKRGGNVGAPGFDLAQAVQSNTSSTDNTWRE